MDYIELSFALKSHKMHIFTLGDIKNLFPTEKVKTIKNNFTRWISKGYFIRLKRELYQLVEKPVSGVPDLLVANKLYEPSYVSLETALSFYSIIPDIAAGVTSVTIRPTRRFRNKYDSFYYRTCQKRAFTGYRLITYEGFKVYIADEEKALVDFLYYRLRSGLTLNFEEERLNRRILKKIDWAKASRYAKLFNNRTINCLKECKEYAGC